MTTEGSEDLEHAEVRYRIHPLSAWTAERHLLGTAPQPLLHDEEAVAVVRLPEGWPLVIQGPPALLWRELAEGSSAGCSLTELAAPWIERADDRDSVLASLAELLERWEGLGLVSRRNA